MTESKCIWKERFRRFVLFGILAAWTATGCKSNEDAPSRGETAKAAGARVVTERLDAGDYLFLCVNSGDQSYWLATSPAEVNVGDQIEYDNPLLMKDFRSPSLQRTFPAILFVGRVRVLRRSERPVSRQETLPSGHPLVPSHSSALTAAVPPPGKGEVGSAPGAKRIGELFERRAELNGTQVQVVGKVMKFNAGIMGWNWVHLQDGSGADGAMDLTLTTKAQVRPGELVWAEGTLVADKTLEKGYYFPVLIEGATIRPLAPLGPHGTPLGAPAAATKGGATLTSR